MAHAKMRALALLLAWGCIVTLVVLFAQYDSSARILRRGGNTVPPVPFTSLSFGTFAKYGNGSCPATPKCFSGDTFMNTWADDGNIYTASGDSSTWNHSGGCSFPCQDANIMFSSLSDFSPTVTGTLVNIMGNWNQIDGTSDGANYKTTSMISVQGTLIQSVIRQSPSTWLSAQLIKSTDHGSTWTPIPPAGVNNAEPYVSPMFTDQKFRTPSFFQYGQDYQTQTVDRSDTFVYAMAPDITSGSGNFYLGRVLVSAIANLSLSDWQFYQGGNGAIDANWGSLSTAASVLSDSLGQQVYFPSPVYLPAFGTYLMMLTETISTPDRIWRIYQGTHPWGPWSLVQTNEWNTGNPQAGAYGFYFPAIVVKSIETDGGRNMALLVAGDYTTVAGYTMFIVPVTVN